MSRRPPPTIDEMADILPPLVRALGEIVEMMEGLVDVACHATNVQETTADTLADLGHTLTEYAHTLMQEATERRRTGRGSVPLTSRVAAGDGEALPVA
ncbi:hypothetical protein VQ03_04080 [Methylobacterium tarhaniae]|uniref:Uncharacterized protein n=1 Tax=Methylobacterium tarhaniae TaxID=1187852 RepID=A0A0J6TF07_9HYPH|nr:hypothetical protein [Methylobacterium tarhaniae]KMO44268.1 hypothetical protein VQ03_04080 [Methylobacterium tarhaniae]